MASFVVFARTVRGAAVAVAMLLLPFLACQEGDGSDVCVIQAKDYDQSCSVDSDCAAVTEIPGCGACPCQTGAVNQRDLTRYGTNLQRPLSVASVGACNCPCEAVAPHCCGGVCTNRCGCPADPDASSDAETE